MQPMPQWWIIDKLDVRDVELDFTSSSGGRPSTRAVFAGDTCLVNALDYVQFNADPTQVIVCAECGNTGCSAGGWICMRRFGDFVAFIPAFGERFDAWNEALRGFEEPEEYSPPPYVVTCGIPMIPCCVYTECNTATSALPGLEAVKLITAGEAVWLTQWLAPLHVLGKNPQRPRLLHEAILAVNDGDLIEEIECLRGFLDDNFNSSAALAPVATYENSAIEFYLEGPGTPAWRPLSHIGDRLAFHFEPNTTLDFWVEDT
ncbi:hypothetical protein CA54_34100 [Symmachiella macrocystis]|uniref:Uncharacterized protein n=1 Tax=Symmachiella macrocystis TaxID=2527985 RepID=A0A5C6BSX6_9PLAN|nr:hypothetical protein [Symmachiella macrocystis]TWU14541.1 hypothetical protein CA54_34100 [Symmachiella macrocystis]